MRQAQSLGVDPGALGMAYLAAEAFGPSQAAGVRPAGASQLAGPSAKASAPVEVTMRFSSTSSPGSGVLSEPVAIRRAFRKAPPPVTVDPSHP